MNTMKNIKQRGSVDSLLAIVILIITVVAAVALLGGTALRTTVTLAETGVWVHSLDSALLPVVFSTYGVDQTTAAAVSDFATIP